MAPVFSRDAWRCVWHMLQVTWAYSAFVPSFFNFNLPFPSLILKCGDLQNDLVHGWGLDFALQRCVEVCDLHFDFVSFFSNLHLSTFLVSDYAVFLKYQMKQPAHKKIGVVDAQWVVHQTIPSLGNQVDGKSLSLHSVVKRSNDPFGIGYLSKCFFWLTSCREKCTMGSHHGKGYVEVSNISWTCYACATKRLYTSLSLFPKSF